MGYVRAPVPVGLTEEEERQAHLDLRRREVVATEEDLAMRRANRKWDVISAIASGVIPIATFLGLQKWWK